MEDDNEITRDELILRTLDVFKFLAKKWFIFVSFIAIAIIATFTLRQSNYIASTSILIENSNVGRGVFGITASQLGLNSEQEISGEKVEILLKSQRIQMSTFADSVEIDGQISSLGAHMYRILIEDKTHPRGVEKLSSSEKGKLSSKTLNLLSVLFSRMINVNTEKDELLKFEVICDNEDLAFHLSTSMIKSVNDFLKKSTIGPFVRNQKIVEKKLDSIRTQLFLEEEKYAQIKDNSTMLVKTMGYKKMVRLERKIKVLNEMYIESIKNLELLKFKAKVNKIELDVVDKPKYPLPQEKMSDFKAVLIGIIIGTSSAIILISIMAFLRHVKSIVEQRGS